MKFLIVGRTAHGKDYLRTLLENTYGWNFVKSRTTRKPRYIGEDTHIFITREEATAIPESEIIAKTEINGELYFATKEDLKKADAYIIDPNGIEYLLNCYTEELFAIIYINADKPDVDKHARERAKASPDPEKEFETYQKRYEAEHEQFSNFEFHLRTDSFYRENCKFSYIIKNDYKTETMANMANRLELWKNALNNV